MKIDSMAERFAGRDATVDAVLRSVSDRDPAELELHSPTLETLTDVATELAGSFTGRRDVLVSALQEHNRLIGNDRGEMLAARLADPNSVIIISGQQPWVMGGPLMTFAKIAGTVHLARQLEERRGHPVVPVFWNHSEDHDLDEVNRFFSLRDGEVVMDRLPYEHEGRALESLELDALSVSAASEWLGEDLADLRPRTGERHATWVSRIILTLMPDLEVVHAEPSTLRPLQGEIFQALVRDHDRFVGLIDRRTEALSAAGFPEQASLPGAGESLLFRLDESGRRVRATANSATADEALAHPERFSCSVLARAVAQQAALPIVAHVNGPAENAYFAQTRDLFNAVGLDLPVCWPRPSVTLLNPKDAATAEALGLDAAKLVTDPDRWPDPPSASHDMVFDDAEQRVLAVFDDLDQASDDDGISRAVAGASKKAMDVLAKLRRRFDRESERAGAAGRGARRRLREFVYPRGRPQERLLGPIVLLRRDPAIVGRVLSRIDPLDFRHHLVTLDEQDFDQ